MLGSIFLGSQPCLRISLIIIPLGRCVLFLSRSNSLMLDLLLSLSSSPSLLKRLSSKDLLLFCLFNFLSRSSFRALILLINRLAKACSSLFLFWFFENTKVCFRFRNCLPNLKINGKLDIKHLWYRMENYLSLSDLYLSLYRFNLSSLSTSFLILIYSSFFSFLIASVFSI